MPAAVGHQLDGGPADEAEQDEDEEQLDDALAANGAIGHKNRCHEPAPDAPVRLPGGTLPTIAVGVLGVHVGDERHAMEGSSPGG